LSSRARNNPVPGLALYGATKAFVHQLAESLADEYWGQIDILSIQPDTVRTKLENPFGDAWYRIEVDQLVKTSIAQLGKSTETYPHWKHAVREYLSWINPRCCCNKGKEITAAMNKETPIYEAALKEYSLLKEPWLVIHPTTA